MYRLTRSYKGIVIDAGHGGTDSGATGNGIVEKDLTLKIAQYIHNRLDDLGIKNVLIRNTDETINPTERVERVNNAYGTSGDVIVVSNHINAGGGGFTYRYIIWLGIKTAIFEWFIYIV